MNNRELQINWNNINVKLESDIFTDDDMLLLEIKQEKHSGRFQISYINTKKDTENLISE